jgi:hypothetical protein
MQKAEIRRILFLTSGKNVLEAAFQQKKAGGIAKHKIGGS